MKKTGEFQIKIALSRFINNPGALHNSIKHPTFALPKLSDGVTGNTSGFGSEESRFEP